VAERAEQVGSRPANEFTFGSFITRLAASLVLVLATYNPSGYSFFHWVRNAMSADGLGPEHFLVGVVLLIGWVILVIATSQSMGVLGLVLGAALLGGLVWLFVDLGWLALDSWSALTWVILLCLSTLLAVGLCWSHIWRRLTGQFEVEDSGD
jgi:hypothetical protein